MPSSLFYAFILSFLAGISTVIGALLIFFDKNKNNKIITMSLSFAAGVMICVSLTDLLPNSFKMILNTNNIFPRVILMLIFMTIFIGFASFSLPTAIALYWIVTYSFMFLQSYIMKLAKKHEENKYNKNKKNKSIKEKLKIKEGLKYGKNK